MTEENPVPIHIVIKKSFLLFKILDKNIINTVTDIYLD